MGGSTVIKMTDTEIFCIYKKQYKNYLVKQMQL